MINLAGVIDADDAVMTELQTAHIPIVKARKDRYSEVPYTIKGKLKDWNFERAWCYMIATAPEGKGLPLDAATQLHFKEYPNNIEPNRTAYSNGPIRVYGQSVRVAGHCGCPSPKDWNFRNQEKKAEKLLKKPWKEITPGELLRLLNEHKIIGETSVDNYHIESQEGLDELARTIKDRI